MKNRPAILLAEEDDFAAELIIEILQEQYQVYRPTQRQSVLEAVKQHSPALLLLNLSNSKSSGLAVCKAIRDNDNTADLPIIFLSDHPDDNELFSVYEVGGDDYLSSSVTATELGSRISHTLAQHIERHTLKADLSNAFSVAMTAMSSAAEVGEILQFLRASFNCTDYLSICKEVLSTLSSFWLDARVQIRGQQTSISYSDLGSCSAVEESIFTTMAQQGRLVSFKAHSACTYEHITSIVKNMPIDNVDRYGRMSDNLALLCEAVNERVIALDNEIVIKQQKESFAELVDVVNVSLVDMNQQLVNSLQVALVAIQRV